MSSAKTDNYFYAREAECMDRPQLQALQLQRLQQTVQHAYEHVAHYHKALDEARLKPADLGTLDDLAKFPFTVKDDLRAAYPFNLFAVPMNEVVRVHASSGTTGKPTVVGYTATDINTWADLMARSIACAGGRPGDIAHNAYGYGLFTGGLGAHYGAERLGCTVIPMSGGNSPKQIQLLQDFGAQILFATPSYALNIAEIAAKQGDDLASGPLRVGIFGAEPWSEGMRSELETRLGLQAIDIYGLSEILGPGVASECPEQAGLHGWEDHFLFEIIDPKTLQPLPCGEVGELVITTLTKQALPILRYRTHDITWLTDERCACGRSHVRIKRVIGRNDDMLIIRGVNVYPSQIEAALVGLEGLAPHYQLVVRRDGTLDTLSVDVEVAPGFSGDRKQLASTTGVHIKSMVGVTCCINVLDEGQVPRSQGKAVRVRDLRSQ
ncbi:MAG TPA: phenylacetate--CoA ligase [Gammaproteobacteria bacterium]|nr:phenylacetate--CoA ligase [Gammaproteobacteria bacterium]